MAIFTFALVVCGGIGFWATKRAADATYDYARTTDEMMHRQLRAYVMLSDARVTLNVDTGKVSLSVNFKNSGQTPAINVVTHAAVTVKGFPNSGPLNLKEFQNTDSGPYNIGSGQPIPAWGSFDCPRAVVEAIQAGSHVVYYFGEIEYDDIFGHKHKTKFKMRSDNTLQVDAMYATPDGNEVD